MTRVWAEFPYGQSRQCVMLAIANFANDYNVAWPGQETIAKAAKMSGRQVIRVTRWLQEQGHLAIFPRRHPTHGGVTSNAYIVLTGLNRTEVRRAISAVVEIGGDPNTLAGFVDQDNPPDLLSYPPLAAGTDKMSVSPRHREQGDTDIDAGSPVTLMADDPKEKDQSTVIEKESAADGADVDDIGWLSNSRIVGESTLDQMTPAERAQVASPAAPEQPPDPTELEWVQMMRAGLRGAAYPGGFSEDDIIAVCQRFFDLTQNPPPAYNKGNANWRDGTVAIVRTFYGSLKTMYHSRGQPMPAHEKQRQLLFLCMDLFFTPGAGYDHIKAGTPRALQNSMPGLIGDLVRIAQVYGLNGALPNATHIDGWIAQTKGGKHAKRRRPEPGKTDEAVRGNGGPDPRKAARDRQRAEQLIAQRPE